MLIKAPKNSDVSSSEITDETLFRQRRRFLRTAVNLALTSTIATPLFVPASARAGTKLSNVKKSAYTIDEELTPFEDVTHYNNFYEFTTEKRDVAEMAQGFQARPWTVEVNGEVHKPRTFDIDDAIKRYALEERIYRLRCVEAWSMVIPWVGFPLAKLLKDVEPTANGKYVEFTTLHDPERMPGQRRKVLPWPYVEGLRLDEAMHPLTILAVGLYGEVLPPQNGAPLRLVVPWKYGFKCIKSIVRIRLTEKQPRNTWQVNNAREYGFYANVNPNVDHPRWSQSRERRIGEFFKRKTLMFNGYGEEVAGLYTGMDLAKFY